MPWDIQAIDTFVEATIYVGIGTAIVFALMILRMLLTSGINKGDWELGLIAIGVFGGFGAVYIAYGSLRNQTMMAAETAINQDAGRLLDWERSAPHVRCVYSWFDRSTDPTDPVAPAGADRMSDACLARIVADRDNFTETMLYVEEVFFILQQAKEDQDDWGSGYAKRLF